MAEPFKELINTAALRMLAEELTAGTPEFPGDDFLKAATAGLSDLELKARVRHAAGALFACLPSDWSAALGVMLRGMGQHLPDDDDAEVTRGFHTWPMLQVVETHGLEEPVASLAALRKMTKRFSAEFAVRPYLVRHPDLAWSTLENWTGDPSVHVRRLVSEGSRPRLPWGRQLKASIADPSRGLAVLERLKDDSMRYVQRSVANHLNDVSKDHPATVLATARRWLADASPGRKWIVLHGLRTLFKQGHSEALALHGFHPPKLRLQRLSLNPSTVVLGETLTVEATLVSTAEKAQRLMVDLVVYFRRKNGRLSPKVFKGVTMTLEAGSQRVWTKKMPMKQVTTRRHYPGLHKVGLQVNGEVLGEAEFMLETGA